MNRFITLIALTILLIVGKNSRATEPNQSKRLENLHEEITATTSRKSPVIANPSSFAPKPNTANDPTDAEPKEQPTDPSDQRALGLRYYSGVGVTKDFQKSALWFKKASDQGDLAAQADLAKQYWNAEGVKKDRELAIRLVRDAAEKGNAHAQLYLAGTILIKANNNDGLTPRNRSILAEVRQWLNKASAQGGEDGRSASQILSDMDSAISEELARVARISRESRSENEEERRRQIIIDNQIERNKSNKNY